MLFERSSYNTLEWSHHAGCGRPYSAPTTASASIARIASCRYRVTPGRGRSGRGPRVRLGRSRHLRVTRHNVRSLALAWGSAARIGDSVTAQCNSFPQHLTASRGHPGNRHNVDRVVVGGVDLDWRESPLDAHPTTAELRSARVHRATHARFFSVRDRSNARHFG